MPGVPSYWTTYLATSDITRSIEAVKQNGGALVTGPMPVFEMGHLALCQDAVGAMVGLWQPIGFPGFGKYGENNSPAWFDLQSEDPQRAATFYHDVFGATVVPMSDTSHAMIGTPAVQWFSVSKQPAPMPASWNPVIKIDSLSRTTDELKRLGATILMNEMPVPGGKVVVFSDPVVQAPLICFEAE
jgi:predicted enzyme related to lactoylglutathione lyase